MVRNSNLRHKTEQYSFAAEGLKTAGWKKRVKTVGVFEPESAAILTAHQKCTGAAQKRRRGGATP